MGSGHQTGQSEAQGKARLALVKSYLQDRLANPALEIDVQYLGGALAAQLPAPAVQTEKTAARLLLRLAPQQIHLAHFAAATTIASRAQHAPCAECFDRRSLSTMPIDEQWAVQLGFAREGGDAPYLTTPALENIGLLAQHILQRASGPLASSNANTENTANNTQIIFSIDLISQEIAQYELISDAFCQQCAQPQPVSEAAATLSLRSHLPAQSGKSRMRGLLDYRLPVKALINPVCGAAGVHLVPGYVQSITAPVFAQYVQRARQAKPRMVGWSGLCTRSDESRVAGMLESLERQAGMLALPELTATVASYAELGAQALDPALCFAYNEESYARPLQLTRYRPDLPLEWVWGYSMIQKRALLIPKQLVFYDRINTSLQDKLLDNNSSGCALGSCHEEAAVKALLELLERDSFVLAWHRMLSLPRIDPLDCPDLKARMILDRIEHLNLDITLLDGRLDMKIPTVIAIARRRDGAVGAMSVGASASLDPKEAVRGALLEAATSIVEMGAMYEANKKRVSEVALDFYKVESVMDHSLLYALPEMAGQLRWLDNSRTVRGFQASYAADQGWYSQGDIGADLQKILAELQRCGMQEAVLVDLTTPEQRQLGLVTVRVVVPGLAPIDFGHPRNRVEHLPRLHSAPAAAGLRSLHQGGNPLPHPFP